MVAMISRSHYQYQHTINTLKYADRGKEIRTHIQKIFTHVDTHVSDYQRMIDSLQVEVCRLKKELADKESQLSVKPAEKSAGDELSWLNILSLEITENVQERINFQKALFELEETNLRNRNELRRLDEAISKQQVIEMEGGVVKTLRERRQVILDNIRDNDEAGADYQKEIETNEKRCCQLQEMIDEAIKNNGNKTYLLILNKYRLLVMANTELQYEIAMRDQVIHDQREAHKNLWNLLLALGLDQRRLLEHAAAEGIAVGDWLMSSDHEPLTSRQGSPILGHHNYKYPLGCSSYSGPSCTPEQQQNLPDCSVSCDQYSLPSFHDVRLSTHNQFSDEGTTEKCLQAHHLPILCKSYPVSPLESSLMSEGFTSALSFSPKSNQQQKDVADRSF